MACVQENLYNSLDALLSRVQEDLDMNEQIIVRLQQEEAERKKEAQDWNNVIEAMAMIHNVGANSCWRRKRKMEDQSGHNFQPKWPKMKENKEDYQTRQENMIPCLESIHPSPVLKTIDGVLITELVKRPPPKIEGLRSRMQSESTINGVPIRLLVKIPPPKIEGPKNAKPAYYKNIVQW